MCEDGVGQFLRNYVDVQCIMYIVRVSIYSGWPPTWKSWGISHWSEKSQGNCGSRVMCYCSCDSCKINNLSNVK